MQGKRTEEGRPLLQIEEPIHVAANEWDEEIGEAPEGIELANMYSLLEDGAEGLPCPEGKEEKEGEPQEAAAPETMVAVAEEEEDERAEGEGERAEGEGERVQGEWERADGEWERAEPAPAARPQARNTEIRDRALGYGGTAYGIACAFSLIWTLVIALNLRRELGTPDSSTGLGMLIPGVHARVLRCDGTTQQEHISTINGGRDIETANCNFDFNTFLAFFYMFALPVAVGIGVAGAEYCSSRLFARPRPERAMVALPAHEEVDRRVANLDLRAEPAAEEKDDGVFAPENDPSQPPADAENSRNNGMGGV